MGSIVVRIGSNIRTFREKQGLSQEKLAAIAGLHRAYIGQIERGEKNIGLQNLEKYSLPVSRIATFSSRKTQAHPVAV